MSKILKTAHTYFHRGLVITIMVAGLIGEIAPLVGAFPPTATLAKALVPAAAILAQVITVAKFLDGQKAWDATPAGQAAASVAPPTFGGGLAAGLAGQPFASKPHEAEPAGEAPVAKAIPVRRHRKPPPLPPTPPAA